MSDADKEQELYEREILVETIKSLQIENTNYKDMYKALNEDFKRLEAENSLYENEKQKVINKLKKDRNNEYYETSARSYAREILDFI